MHQFTDDDRAIAVILTILKLLATPEQQKLPAGVVQEYQNSLKLAQKFTKSQP